MNKAGRALRTAIGLALIAPVMLIWMVGVASATTPATNQPQCSLSLTGSAPSSLTDGASYPSVGYDLKCEFLPLNLGSLVVVVPGNGGTWAVGVLPTSSVQPAPYSTKTSPCPLATNYAENYMPVSFEINSPPDPPTNTTSAQCTTGIGSDFQAGGGTNTGPPWDGTPPIWNAGTNITSPLSGDSIPWNNGANGPLIGWPQNNYGSNQDFYIAGAITTSNLIFGQSPPCSVVSVTGHQDPLTLEFTDYTYSFDIAGPVNRIIASANVNPGFTSNTPPNYSPSFNTAASQYTGGNNPGTLSYVYTSGDPTPSGDGTSNLTMDFNQTTVNSTSGGNNLPTQLNAWCYASGQGWFSLGNLLSSSIIGETYTPPTPPTGPPTSTIGQCLASDGLGIDPASWVPGLVKMGTCGLQWLFIPSSKALSSLANSFGVQSNAPTVGSDSASQWLGNIGYMLAEGPAQGAQAIQTCATNGCSAPLITDGITIHAGSRTFSVSAPQAITAVATSDGSWSAILVDILAAALLVVFFLEVARTLRKTTGSTE